LVVFAQASGAVFDAIEKWQCWPILYNLCPRCNLVREVFLKGLAGVMQMGTLAD
jgi:hypothetical protein